MAAAKRESRVTLMTELLETLNVSQKELAERLDVSAKTISRWCARNPVLGAGMVTNLCAVANPTAPSLAIKIATTYGYDLAQLGVTSSAAAKLGSNHPEGERLLADALVCAAADVADVSPRVMRPALAAALARARDLGLTIDSALALLTAPAPKNG